MVLKTKKVSQAYNMRVYTDDGLYFGDVEEAVVTSTKVFGWRIKSTKSSYLTKVLGGAKGVLVPHQYVKSVGDVFIISNAAIPSYEEKEEEAAEEV